MLKNSPRERGVAFYRSSRSECVFSLKSRPVPSYASRRYWRTMVGRNSESETGQRQKREAAGLNSEGGAKRSREDKERLGSPAVCCRCSVCKTVFLNDRAGETEVLLRPSQKKQLKFGSAVRRLALFRSESHLP